ncbi:sulfotransferase family protein [Ketobacter sp.]|uniref:sulfotransferase family protein n=1 Tax=Ketobacter sp. TaxID=2083498 RepID=UPI000F212206|nr:sulfotransferase [Ketobacter sp.]RLT93966.1 MAG: sulfotransferase [Ketobacter sp.]
MLVATLTHIPRLLRYSFLPVADGAYSRFSWQRLLVMLLFWPLFAGYLLITGLFLWLDHCFFPQFRKVEVRAPVFVLGIPRSGTTFLHRLLAGDQERFTTMTLWELIFAPSITQRALWRGLGTLDRLIGKPAQRLLGWIENKIFSGLDGVHSTRLHDPEEDYLALIPVLQCFLLVLPFGDPRFLDLSRFDDAASAQQKSRLLRFYRGLIQRHLYVHGVDKIFLSKNPSFTPMLNTLASGFSDARFIACVRNPNQAVPSQVSSILVGARLFSGHVDTGWWRTHLMDMLAYYYQHLMRHLPALLQAHSVVRMEQLAADPQQHIEQLYRAFGLTPSHTYQHWLQAEADKARHYRSGHQYQGHRLGISADALFTQFNFVYQQLGYEAAE